MEQETEPDAATETPASDNDETGRTHLVVFDTSKQTTELRVKDGGIQCYLLNKQTNVNKWQWGLAPSEIASILKHRRYEVTVGNRAQTGRFDLGPRKNWLYSKRLFPDPDYLRGALHELLLAAIQEDP